MIPSRMGWEQRFVKEVSSDKIILDADELREIMRLAQKEFTLTEADYFNCMSNTKLSNGKFMSKDDADLLAKSLFSWPKQKV